METLCSSRLRNKAIKSVMYRTPGNLRHGNCIYSYYTKWPAEGGTRSAALLQKLPLCSAHSGVSSLCLQPQAVERTT